MLVSQTRKLSEVYVSEVQKYAQHHNSLCISIYMKPLSTLIPMVPEPMVPEPMVPEPMVPEPMVPDPHGS